MTSFNSNAPAVAKQRLSDVKNVEENKIYTNAKNVVSRDLNFKNFSFDVI